LTKLLEYLSYSISTLQGPVIINQTTKIDTHEEKYFHSFPTCFKFARPVLYWIKPSTCQNEKVQQDKKSKNTVEISVII
jgi:hypothetical protein